MSNKKVPLVWNHCHNDPSDVLGRAIIENRDEGVYVHCSFDNTKKAQDAKEQVMHGYERYVLNAPLSRRSKTGSKQYRLKEKISRAKEFIRQSRVDRIRKNRNRRKLEALKRGGLI